MDKIKYVVTEYYTNGNTSNRYSEETPILIANSLSEIKSVFELDSLNEVTKEEKDEGVLYDYYFDTNQIESSNAIFEKRVYKVREVE